MVQHRRNDLGPRNRTLPVPTSWTLPIVGAPRDPESPDPLELSSSPFESTPLNLRPESVCWPWSLIRQRQLRVGVRRETRRSGVGCMYLKTPPTPPLRDFQGQICPTPPFMKGQPGSEKLIVNWVGPPVDSPPIRSGEIETGPSTGPPRRRKRTNPPTPRIGFGFFSVTISHDCPRLRLREGSSTKHLQDPTPRCRFDGKGNVIVGVSAAYPNSQSLLSLTVWRKLAHGV